MRISNNGGLFERETMTLKNEVFQYLVDEEIKRSLRYQNFSTLLILEPDRKPENEETLSTLVQLMKKNIRETDFIGRVQNNRFGILLLYADLDGAYVTASRIKDHVNQYLFSGEKSEHLSLTIGGACFPTNSAAIDKDELFRQADEAFKVAKQSRGRVYFPGLPANRNGQEGDV